MNTISEALNALTTNDSKTSKKNGSALGKDDFLKLLITQMQNQDPLSPMQDKDYIAQLATFSSLEQMTNMNTSLNNLLSSMSTNLLQYSELIGKKISYAELSADGTSHTFKEGVVSSVERSSNGFVIRLSNGKTTSPEYVSSILDNSTETSKAQ
jgi:flagellar basal-body rod modification protein FlgD